MKKTVIALLIVGLISGVTAVRADEGNKVQTMRLASPAFKDREYMPKKFTCQGLNVSPELTIDNIPGKARSLALIMDDPDAPMGTWVHWTVYDIPVTAKIEEGAIPGKQGINDFGRKNYGGPCPPSGTHRYFFKIYALDKKLGLGEGAGKADLEAAMEGHVLEKAELVGLYRKQSK